MPDPARTRLVALIGPLSGARKATHTGGHQIISDEKMLPVADVLLLVADEEPGAMLFRYTIAGESGGDTWHPSVVEAESQAAHEYGDALLLPWTLIPDEIDDAHRFVVQYALDRLNDRGRW